MPCVSARLSAFPALTSMHMLEDRYMPELWKEGPECSENLRAVWIDVSEAEQTAAGSEHSIDVISQSHGEASS